MQAFTDRFRQQWREWRGLFIFIAIMLLFRSAIADWNQVPSGSMTPAILAGDRIVVDKLAYGLRIPFTQRSVLRWGEPSRGDVVTFLSPADERLLVKRIIAVPGDVVTLAGERLVVNGEAAVYRELATPEIHPEQADAPRYRYLEESILGQTRTIMLSRHPHGGRRGGFPPVEVPPGHYLVLGDNRDNSTDSREMGFVLRERILGRAKSIAFSLDYDNYYRPRMDRFFADLS